MGQLLNLKFKTVSTKTKIKSKAFVFLVLLLNVGRSQTTYLGVVPRPNIAHAPSQSGDSRQKL